MSRAWKKGLWVMFGSGMVALTFALENPLPLVLLAGLSYPAEDWLEK